jgi:hypothetical protein
MSKDPKPVADSRADTGETEAEKTLIAREGAADVRFSLRY